MRRCSECKASCRFEYIECTCSVFFSFGLSTGCSNGIATVSRMAVSFNLPHITYAGTSDDLGNKKEFSMLSRISYTMDAFAKFYVQVLKVSMNAF